MISGRRGGMDCFSGGSVGEVEDEASLMVDAIIVGSIEMSLPIAF